MTDDLSDYGSPIHEAPPKKEPKPSRWKGAKKIMDSPDDRIKLIGEYPTGIYYSVCGATVKYQGKGHGKKREFLCLKNGHVCNDCGHVRRLRRYREEHPGEVAAA